MSPLVISPVARDFTEELESVCIFNHTSRHGVEVKVQCLFDEQGKQLQEEIRSLQTQLHHQTEVADTVKAELESFKATFVPPTGLGEERIMRIWESCLGNRTYQKAHFIDALGKTTRLLVEDRNRAERERDEAIQKLRLLTYEKGTLHNQVGSERNGTESPGREPLSDRRPTEQSHDARPVGVAEAARHPEGVC
jgi:hypothetical protein